MKLELENFRHHRSKTIELPNQGVILLSGESGSGKSTILTAIEFVLYGKVQKVNSFSTKGASVRFTYDGIALKHFSNEDGEHPPFIVIFRKKDPVLLELTVGTKKFVGTEAQEIINRLFGTHDIFLASSYLKQGAKSELIDGSVRDKTSLVESFISDKGDISKYKTKIDDEVTKTSSQMENCRGGVDVLERQILQFKTMYTRELALLNEELKKGNNFAEEIASIQSRLSTLREKQVVIDVHERSRLQIVENNTKCRKEVQHLKASLANCTSFLDLEKSRKSIEELYAEIDTINHQKRVSDLEAKVTAKQSVLEKTPNPNVLEEPCKSDEVGLLLAIRTSEKLLDDFKAAKAKNESVTNAIAALGEIPTPTLDDLRRELSALERIAKYNDMKKSLPDVGGQIGRVEKPNSEEKNKIYALVNSLKFSQQNRDEIIAKNKKVDEELKALPFIGKSKESLEALLKVAELQDQLAKLEKPEKSLEDLEAERNELLAWRSKLELLLSNESVESLEQKLQDVKLKLEKHAIKVSCPTCTAELLYSNGQLKPVPVKKKPLPSRLGVKPPVVVQPPAPTTPEVEISTEPIDDLLAAKCSYEHSLKAMKELSDPSKIKTVSQCDEAINAIDNAIKSQREYYTLSKQLEGCESTTLTKTEILSQLDALKKKDTLVSQLTCEPEDKSKELEAANKQLKGYEREEEDYNRYIDYYNKVKQRETLENTMKELVKDLNLSEYTRDIPTVKADIDKVLKYQELSSKLTPIPDEPIDDVASLKIKLAKIKEQQTAYKQTKAYLDLKAEVDQLTQQLVELKSTCDKSSSKTLKEVEDEIKRHKEIIATYEKNQTVMTQIAIYEAKISAEPENKKEELETLRLEIDKDVQREAQLQKLVQYQNYKSQLDSWIKDLESKTSEQDNLRRAYSLLEKLRLKALEAESLAMEDVIAAINQEMAMQLETLFHDPITVRFETTKTLQDGRTKFCINLAVNYRGEDYDNLNSLSGGELARVSLAITLALNKTANSPILMLDESLSALDSDLIDDVVEALKDVSTQYHIPIIVVLHNTCMGSFDTIVNF